MNCNDCGGFLPHGCECDPIAGRIRREPTKIEPGSDLHFTLLMAPYHLNLVVGQDRQHLLAFARDVWNAAKAGVDVPRCPDCNQRMSEHTNGCPVYPPLGNAGVAPTAELKENDRG